jgi:hypothetical protein
MRETGPEYNIMQLFPDDEQETPNCKRKSKPKFFFFLREGTSD